MPPESEDAGRREQVSLDSAAQLVHLVAIILVVLAIALVMAPAALHRQMHQQAVTARFIRVASTLLLASMLAMALGLCLEVFLVGKVIVASQAVGLFILLWIVQPRRERARQV